MKIQILILTSALLFHQSIYSQDISQYNSARTPQPVQEITSINKIKDEIKSNINDFKKVQKANDTTGYRNAYFKGKKLQLVSAYYRDTSTVKLVDWYFQKGQLIFSEQLWTDVKTKDTLNRERFYLQNERLIAWFKFDQPVDRKSVAFKKVDSKMRDYIKDLKLDNRK